MLIKSIIVNTFSKSENVFPFRKIVFPFLRSRHQTLNDDLLDADFSFLDDCRGNSFGSRGVENDKKKLKGKEKQMASS